MSNFFTPKQRDLSNLYRRGENIYHATIGQNAITYAHLPTDHFGNPLADVGDEITLLNGIVYNVPDDVSDSQFVQAAQFDTAIENLHGMYALVRVKNKSIELLRDPLGIKPLYYFYQHGQYVISSSLLAFASLPEEAKGLIRELKAGQHAVMTRNKLTVTSKDTTVVPHLGTITAHELEKQLFDAMIAPLKKYIRKSKLTVGVSLSGGLDSSVLCCLIEKYLSNEEKKHVKYFVAATNNGEDVKYARLLPVADRLVEVPLPPPSVRLMRDLAKITESPMGRLSRPGYILYSLAREMKKYNIKMAISGEGADELFFGYERFNAKESFILDHHNFMFNEFQSTLLQRLDRVYSYFTIEARVPYLYQPLVRRQLATRHCEHQINKQPLRALGANIGVPRQILERKKLTMTEGSTTYVNKQRAAFFGITDVASVCRSGFEEHFKGIDPFLVTQTPIKEVQYD